MIGPEVPLETDWYLGPSGDEEGPKLARGWGSWRGGLRMEIRSPVRSQNFASRSPERIARDLEAIRSRSDRETSGASGCIDIGFPT